MRMRWLDLLFAHWSLPPAQLEPLIPPPLTLDMYQGRAWVGVVPFRMENVGPRWLPALPGVSAFPELNVRTYVTYGGRPGVWFFSLDAANPLAVVTARRLFHLPYFHARMRVRRNGERVDYASERVRPPGVFRGCYRPLGPVLPPSSGGLVPWLTERYALYARTPRGQLYRTDVHHVPWSLRPAEAEISANTVCDAHGFCLPDEPPLLHVAAPQDAIAWLPERVA